MQGGFENGHVEGVSKMMVAHRNVKGVRKFILPKPQIVVAHGHVEGVRKMMVAHGHVEGVRKCLQ